MHRLRRFRFSVALGAIVVALALSGLSTSASGVPSVRGFDGSTVKVAGLALMSNFKDADIGAIARFDRANETKEVKGITFDYVGNNDDGASPATALSAVRRLITQDQVFAIVPDMSASNPGDYLDAQHMLRVGWPFDASYCTPKPSTKIYGFGYPGCQTNPNPTYMTDTYGQYYKYVSEKVSKKHPTIANLSQDMESGQAVIKYIPISAAGAGFKVVYSKANLPVSVADYTPYVQEIMSADNGNPPDVFNCLVSVQCIQLAQGLRNAGFKGYILTPVFSDILLKALVDTDTRAQYNTAPSKALSQMTRDIQKVKAGTAVSQSNAMAYFAADLFITAVKKVGAAKLTPEAVQKTLSTITWEIKGLAGPLTYPGATVGPTQNCNAILTDTDTTSWAISEPYGCSSKTFPVPKKLQSGG
jgi:ABC-type branched-subunit amino acid transport system substrate-binding protein